MKQLNRNKRFKFLPVLGLVLSFSMPVFSADSIEEKITRSKEIYNSDPEGSYQLCCEAEADAKKNNTYDYFGDIALCKGRYFILITDYESAGNELSKAIQYFTQKNDFVKLSRAYSLKSILLERIGETDESNKVLLMAYKISKDHGDRDGEINRLTNMTSNFVSQNRPDSAYFYLLKLLELEDFIKDESAYYVQQNLGLYYDLIEDYSKAIYYFLKAKKIADELNMIDSRATITVHLGSTYRKLNDLSTAEKYALESYEISIANGLFFEERDAVIEIVKIYEAQKNFALAFDFQQKLMDVDDRINQLEKVQKVKENEYYLNLAEKEKIIAQQALDVESEKLSAAKARSRNLVLYFVVLFVFVVLIFSIYISLKTRKLNKAIQLSKLILEEKNKEIVDSITYAKRIQDAILPPAKYYQNLFAEVFVMYRPKDIVAGDFYWCDKIGNRIIFAVADCTGHGVPGAMVSVVCHNALNRSVKEFGLLKPSEILEKTSELVVETFVKSDKEVKDGMDISLCVLDTRTGVLEFAGANNPVWVIKALNDEIKPSHKFSRIDNGEKMLLELKGDKQPVGHFENRKAFTNQSIQLLAGDGVYLSSDGYMDQFGGEKGKKFKSKLFKEKLLQIQNSSLNEQHEMIASIFDHWKGDLEQVDDVCVIGVRI